MSRTKTSKRGKGKAEAPGGFKLSPAAWWRTWVTLGWLTTLVLLVMGVRWLDQQAQAARPEPTCRIAWTQVPPALAKLSFDAGPTVVEAITAELTPAPTRKLYDPALVRDVGQQAQDNPWIAEVHRVAKRADGTLAIDATFRRPLAFVEVNDWAYLVDDEGVRLPPDGSLDFVRAQGWHVITGVQAGEPLVGEVWPGEDVQAALKLVRFLDDAANRDLLPFRAQLRAVDVANYNRSVNAFDGMLRLRTAVPRCYINWGAAPGDGTGVEASARRKLDMLRSYYQSHSQFPAGRILDVRDPASIALRDYR